MKKVSARFFALIVAAIAMGLVLAKMPTVALCLVLAALYLLAGDFDRSRFPPPSTDKS